MNTGALAGVTCGLVVGIILVIIIMKTTTKDHSTKCKYDERQQLVRGKGFKYAFFTMMIYNFFFGLCFEFIFEKQIMDTGASMVLGATIGMMVYAIYCIWNEGYISMNENPKKVMAALAIVGAANLCIGIAELSGGQLIENGMLTIRSINLLIGMEVLIIVAVQLVKFALDKKEEA